MLFELSDKDASTFVQNVGYGFASGFLASNNISMPESAMEGHATAQAEQGIPVNPITGQRLDKEDSVQSEPMTQAEKEREAERLFVLFERCVKRIIGFSSTLIIMTGLKQQVSWACRTLSKQRIALVESRNSLTTRTDMLFPQSSDVYCSLSDDVNYAHSVL
jgi:hypothetical protein